MPSSTQNEHKNGGSETTKTNTMSLLDLFEKPSSSPSIKTTTFPPPPQAQVKSFEAQQRNKDNIIHHEEIEEVEDPNDHQQQHHHEDDDNATLRAGVGGGTNTSTSHDFDNDDDEKKTASIHDDWLNKNNETQPLLLHEQKSRYSDNNDDDGGTSTNEISLPPFYDHKDHYDKLKFQEEEEHVPIPVIFSTNNHEEKGDCFQRKWKQWKEAMKYFIGIQQLPSKDAASFKKTSPLLGLFIGSITSALYHCVFSLAMASSITRAHPPPTSSGNTSLLGPMAKMTALGVIVTSPFQIYFLGNDTPALYPSADLFLAPFLSELASVVDDSLYQKRLASSGNQDEDDTFVFLGTFALLASLGMAASSLLCVLAAKVKLANLGAFLPHAVICGFFSSIGVLVWTLSFSVDNNGAKIQDVIKHIFHHPDNDTTRDHVVPTLLQSLIHHAPSFLTGVAMKILCKRNAIWMPILILVLLTSFYIVMLFTSTTLSQAQHAGWFWTTEELVGISNGVSYTHTYFGPPAPFGILSPLFQNVIDWNAVVKGLPTVVAMALIYTLRCSLHAVALKKLSDQLSKKKEKSSSTSTSTSSSMIVVSSSSEASVTGSCNKLNKRPSLIRARGASIGSYWDSYSFDDGFMGSSVIGNGGLEHRGSIRSLLDVENGNDGMGGNSNGRQTLNNLRTLLWYGLGHLISAIVGGFSALPAFAIGATLFELGVEGLAPQYGGIVLLLYCYCSNFSIINYIPKAVFSSLLVVGFLEFTWKWFIQSYTKTKSKWEWLVVPAIVIIAFVVPLLEAVVIGLAASTFIFVGAFYKSGIVKYASTGLTVRSTIDRMDDDLDILDCRGDLIQILVLQNYVFFGNASSILQYIQTMFEEPEMDNTAVHIDFELPPVPKYIVLDFNLVTGMDTSSVDIFAELITLCREESCALLFSGLSKDFRSTLSCGGVKPVPNQVLYCYDLESALGKAEDGLLHEAHKSSKRDMEQPQNFLSVYGGGFRKALAHIETHQGISTANLYGLEKYTKSLTVSPGQFVCGSALNPNGGLIPDSDRGLFFIEQGMLKIMKDPGCSYSLTRRRNNQGNKKEQSLGGGMSTRSATVGNMQNMLKSVPKSSSPSRPFRLAKIGPGWVIGAVEGCSGIRNPGLYSAITKCQLFHLPYSLLPQIEKDDPILALNLFKLLAHIVSRRQMSAIEQMGNLHTIITSPPVTKPQCRLTMGAIKNAMHYVDN